MADQPLEQLPDCVPPAPAKSCYELAVEANKTLGYRCEAGPLGPTLWPCPSGMVCRADVENASMISEKCSGDHLCLRGFAYPVACPALSFCSDGKVVAQPAGYAAAAMIWVVFGLLALCLTARKHHMLHKQDALREEFQAGSPRLLGEGLVKSLPVSIEFREVGMTLKTSKVAVLSGISGSFPSGSLVALMGPSGGGKTTFMNALLDRAAYGEISGTFTINGVDGGFQRVPSLVGFVPQDDVVHANLTVYENLIYNAMLRLPRHVPKAAKIEHVIHVIDVLGMTHIRNHLVGDAERRGISGGQKKRVNIGVELAAMPAIIFMDEPTSGLDGAATIELARCLGQLRLSGLTIICVIHQPRLAVYDEFTHLLLLGKGGRQVYCGRAELIEEYFTGLGFRLPPKENPADWLIDVVCGLSPRYKDDGSVDTDFVAPASLFAHWEFESKPRVFEPSFHWTAGFVPPPALHGVAAQPLVPRLTLGRLKQTYYLLGRSFRQHEMAPLITICCILFVSSATFAHINSDQGYEYALLAKWLTGYGAATPLYYVFVAAFTRPLFTKERLIYQREQKAGTSSVGYFLARNTYNLLMLPFLATSFSLGLYIFATPAQGYDTYLLAALCCGWYWSGAAILVSNVISSELIGTLVLIFWPLLEPTISGSYLMESSPRDAPVSAFTCNRWNLQILFAAESKALPFNVLGMPFLLGDDLLTQLRDRMMPVPQHEHDEAAAAIATQQAVAVLACLGLGFRMFALLSMVLLKYSQGGGYLAQISYVARRISFVLLGGRGLSSAARTTDPDAATQEKQKGAMVAPLLSTLSGGELHMAIFSRDAAVPGSGATESDGARLGPMVLGQTRVEQELSLMLAVAPGPEEARSAAGEGTSPKI